MSPAYEDGLYPVEDVEPRYGHYSTLPQVYEPNEKAPQPLPQAYIVEKSPESAPVPISTDGYGSNSHNGLSKKCMDWRKSVSSPAPSSRSKRILGMKQQTSIWMGAIMLAAAVALAVGLGVGLSTTNSKNVTTKFNGPDGISTTLTSFSTPISSSSSAITSLATRSISTTTAQTSSSIVSTTTAVATSGFIGVSKVQCPGINNTIAVSGTSRFEILCAVHWITGQPAANNNGTVQAVGDNKLVAYTLQECLDYCVEYNDQINKTADPTHNGSGCLAVTYNANLTNSLAKFGQNCFLKDREGVYSLAADTTESAVLISI